MPLSGARIERGRLAMRGGPPVGGYAIPVREKLSGVIEDDHAVAQQAPPLFGVSGDCVGCFPVNGISWWAWRGVSAHELYLDCVGGWCNCPGHNCIN